MKRVAGKSVDILNKDKNLLGTYVYTEVSKPDTYSVDYTDKQGNEKTLVKEVTKADITLLVTQAFNTNVRNFVAGLARPKTGSKLSAYEEFFASKGIDTKGIAVEKLIEKLKDMTK